MKRILALALGGLMATACADLGKLDPTGGSTGALDVRPNGRQRDTKEQHDQREQEERANGQAAGQAATSPISYHGGPVMLGTVNVYLIWYGNWGTNTATTIIPDFITNLSGSPYFRINTTYTNGSGQAVSGNVALAGTTTDNYSQGTALSDAAVQTVVTSAITAKGWPKDPNAVYFVLTSADVNETSGFCTQYCGWHTNGTIGGVDIKYSFVGNPDRCITSCAPQTTSPNGNAGADGLASILAHELEEAISDPDLNAWYDSTGAENADKCAWTFGTTYTTANGAKANMKLGTRDYYIQQNWINQGAGSCGLALAGGCTTDAQCSDGNACNGVETCVAGQCQPGTAVNCNDGNACTADSCDPATGACIHTALSCDDGNPCTDDTCNPATGCVHINNTAPCNDGSACTAGDVCQNGVCTGTPISCDDGNACTTDSCNAATGCVHTTVDCTSGNACLVGACDPALGCSTTPVANGTACTGGTCQNGTCVSSCPVYTGTSSSASKNVYFTLGNLGAVTATGTLSCPAASTTDVDLYLQVYRNGAWRSVASSLGNTCAESIAYTVPTTYRGLAFRWRVAYYAGASTTFSLQSCIK